MPSASALEAGYAEADITPVLGTPLAGRIERWGRGSETIHDPLLVRCLYLQDGEESAFLVSADLFAITEDLRARVLELAPRTALPDRIVLAATHTHSGPGGMDRGLVRRVNSGRYSPRVIEDTAQQFAACMRDAFNARRRAAAGHTSAQWSPPENLAGVNAQPAEVTVLRVEDSDGLPIAIAVAAALMPDNVGVDELLTLSADFPGRLCQTVGEALSNGAGAMFFNGASGDFARDAMPKTTSWESINALGESVGLFAIALSDLIECAELPVAVRSAVEPLPPSLGDAWLPDEIQLTQCAVGTLTFTFTPFGIGQGVLAQQTAADDGAERSVLIGYTNGFAGHVVPEAAFAADTAAARLHHFGPGMAKRLQEQVDRLSGLDVAAAPESGGVPEPAVTDTDGVLYLDADDEAGRRQGEALAGAVRDSFERRIHERAAAGLLLPKNQMLAHVPWFVDASPVTLSQIAFEIRPAWAALDPAQRTQLEGYAHGAGLPMEAAWLLQKEEAVLAYAGVPRDTDDVPRPLMFAVHGDTAGAEGLLPGIRMPWKWTEPPLIRRSDSDAGLAVIVLTPAHAMGAIAGMNSAGVVASAVRNEDGGAPRMATPPFAMQLERALGMAESATALVDELKSTASFDGIDVFAADTATETATVLRGNAEAESFPVFRGLMLDRPLDASTSGDAGDDPRRQLLDFVKSAERIVSAEELAEFVAELDNARQQNDSPNRFISIIFEPKTQRLRARFSGAGLTPDGYTEVPLRADAS